MSLYKKESLDLLRQRIDLAEVLSSHLNLKKVGSSFKALCPFHEEKTPSFMMQKGESHYHCFGCGAHGDAISFLMTHVKMGFTEAIEHLADRFGVHLEREEERVKKAGPSKTELKEALQKASSFYHFYLLHTEEGQKALKYLYDRGIDLDFIRLFEVGYAPCVKNVFQDVMKQEGVSDLALEQAGLVSKAENGKKRDFFSERVTFPIRDALGSVIGFSARKIKEETFGGKYINTAETPLFKKSHVLFGLSYSRKRIAKERKAIIVEGQIDALRLIYAGFNFTVAGQGTAFGESHVQELCNLGVNHVFLALDGDLAGQEAMAKIGDLFQKKGVEVSIVLMPEGKDPDSFLKEQGPEAFIRLLEQPQDYLTFLVNYLSPKVNLESPSGKNELVDMIIKRIKAWEQPVMVHESMRKLATLVGIPESVIGVDVLHTHPIKRSEKASISLVDPDRILETDLLRWLVLAGCSVPKVSTIVRKNISSNYFRDPICKRLYELCLNKEGSEIDFMSFSTGLDEEEDQSVLTEIVQRKVNLQKAEEGVIETVRKILQRQWMEERETIKAKIHSGSLSEEEVLELAKEFDRIKKKIPEVILS